MSQHTGAFQIEGDIALPEHIYLGMLNEPSQVQLFLLFLQQKIHGNKRFLLPK